MAGFNAGAVVEALDFDFTAFGGPKGTIPEPSNKQVKVFFNRVRDMSLEMRRSSKDFDEEALVDDAEVAASVLSALDESSEQYNGEMYNSVTMVCSNVFSREDLENLPYRVQNAFMTWLVEQIRPEGSTPATK